MRNRDQYKMGPVRAYKCPALAHEVELVSHNGVQVVGNPTGVPAKWLPAYLEYASRMYGTEPVAFNIGKETKDAPVIGRAEIQDAWYSFETPEKMLAAINVETPAKAVKVKAEPAPKVIAPKMPKSPAASPVMADYRAELAAFEAHETSPNGPLPQWAEEWLAGLVFELKRDYARALLEHLLNGAAAPAHPGADWADKAHKRAQRLIEKAAA